MRYRRRGSAGRRRGSYRRGRGRMSRRSRARRAPMRKRIGFRM